MDNTLDRLPMPEAGKVAIAFVRCKCVYTRFRLVIASRIGTPAVFAGHTHYSGQNSEFHVGSDAKTAARFTSAAQASTISGEMASANFGETLRQRLQYEANCRKISARIGISLSGRVGLSGWVKVVRIQPRCSRNMAAECLYAGTGFRNAKKPRYCKTSFN